MIVIIFPDFYSTFYQFEFISLSRIYAFATTNSPYQTQPFLRLKGLATTCNIMNLNGCFTAFQHKKAIQCHTSKMTHSVWMQFNVIPRTENIIKITLKPITSQAAEMSVSKITKAISYLNVIRCEETENEKFIPIITISSSLLCIVCLPPRPAKFI